MALQIIKADHEALLEVESRSYKGYQMVKPSFVEGVDSFMASFAIKAFNTLVEVGNSFKEFAMGYTTRASCIASTEEGVPNSIREVDYSSAKVVKVIDYIILSLELQRQLSQMDFRNY